MANKLIKIGLFLTKYVTIPIILLVFAMWFVYFAYRVAIQINKNLNED